MVIDSAFWADLEAQFRTLKQPGVFLVASLGSDGWSVSCDGPRDHRESQRLRSVSESLARRGALALAAPTRENALDRWLNHLRDESPHFHVIESIGGIEGNSIGGRIQDLALASAEYCIVCGTRAFQLAMATTVGLRRDLYPFSSRLNDHPHQPLADLKGELDYWKAHIWNGYHAQIESYADMEMSWTERARKLSFALGGVSYDIAVLNANYVLDCGLRGQDAIRAFQDAEAELLKEVTSAWQSSCERLAITFADKAAAVRDLAEPLRRVRQDLWQLLAQIPPGDSKDKATEFSGTAIIPELPRTAEVRKEPKHGPRPDYEMAARMAEIVARVAPDGRWRSQLDDVCEVLDREGIPCPKTQHPPVNNDPRFEEKGADTGFPSAASIEVPVSSCDKGGYAP